MCICACMPFGHMKERSFHSLVGIALLLELMAEPLYILAAVRLDFRQVSKLTRPCVCLSGLVWTFLHMHKLLLGASSLLPVVKLRPPQCRSCLQ